MSGMGFLLYLSSLHKRFAQEVFAVLMAKALNNGRYFVAQALVKVGRLEAEGVEDDSTAVSLSRRLFQL
jgi:hypothetical protein